MRRLIRAIALVVARERTSWGGRVVALQRLDRHRHCELGVTAPQTQLHRAWCQVGGDLLGRRRQHVQKGEADRRVQGSGETLRKRPGVLATGLGDSLQLAVDLVDIRPQVHGATLAHKWHHVKTWRASCVPDVALSA